MTSDSESSTRHGPGRRGPVGLTEGAPDSSEESLALIFAKEREGDARWVNVWRHWYRLKGHKWVQDLTLETVDAVRLVCRDAAIRNGDARAAGALASQKTVSAVERLSRTDRRLAATVDQWDADPLVLNTPGPLIDLRLLEERPQRPTDYLTKSTAVAPAKPGAACPLWSAFLARITGGDKEFSRFLQRMAGYELTGITSAHALFFLHGTGANGKSVFVNTIAGILGDYATSAPMEVFMASSQDRHPTELADLRGARLVTAVETEEGRRWAEARVKQLTGGDPIKARRMRQDFFEFLPAFKLLIVGNHRPALRGVDEAIRRRFHLVPFVVTIPLEERDPELFEKLKAEWPAILRWALDGYSMFVDEGLSPPAVVVAATSQYLDSEDAFSLWVEECCVRDPSKFTPTRRLYDSWRAWAAGTGEFVGSEKRLSQALAAHGFEWVRQTKARGYLGISLVATAYDASDASFG
jgi:putative DNA primase/helicase